MLYISFYFNECRSVTCIYYFWWWIYLINNKNVNLCFLSRWGFQWESSLYGVSTKKEEQEEDILWTYLEDIFETGEGGAMKRKEIVKMKVRRMVIDGFSIMKNCWTYLEMLWFNPCNVIAWSQKKNLLSVDSTLHRADLAFRFANDEWNKWYILLVDDELNKWLLTIFV